jgi:hypothetical protein
MPDRSLQEDVYDSFMEGRWNPITEASEVKGQWTVKVRDNHGHTVQYSDNLLSEAHNRAMDLVRDAIQQGKFSP